MRSFIIACIIFASIVTLITVNSVYCRSKLDSLLVVCQELKQGSPESSVEKLFTAWQSCRKILSLSVHNSKIENVDNAVMALNSYPDGDKDFFFALSVVTDALHHIKESQSFSAENIF